MKLSTKRYTCFHLAQALSVHQHQCMLAIPLKITNIKDSLFIVEYYISDSILPFFVKAWTTVVWLLSLELSRLNQSEQYSFEPLVRPINPLAKDNYYRYKPP